ncbi:MAG: hypothetical protein HGGPFJEG_01794 [Ignavibacteria bacterium]|nr:hypothetical protein [Ignavibacteria bacterium]
MNKLIKLFLVILIISGCIQFYGCGNPTPENYFNTAVLNTNLLAGFAGNGFSRQLDSPLSKLSDDGQNTSQMTRSEFIKSKTKQIEENYKKIEDLKVTDETKDIIESSKELYKFVIPILNNEYVKLAEMYDSNAPADQIASFTNSIQEKYSAKFKELYDALISNGKAYADKNKIKVHWGN